MPSRLTIAQTHLHDAETALAALSAQNRTLLDDPAATVEQMDAHAAAIDTARETVAAAQREVAAAQRLTDLERQAPAAASTPITVTPRAERDPQRGFASIGHFAQAVWLRQGATRGLWSQPADERLDMIMSETARGLAQEKADLARFGAAAPATFHRETQSTDGLMVPPDFRQEIWKPTYEADDLLPLFAPETTSSIVVQLMADETTPWGASGIKAYWVNEGAQITASKLATSPRQVQLHKAGCLVYATDELLIDTALLTARINEKAPQALAWLISESLIRGNGVAKPLGYEDAAYGGVVAVAKETNQKAASISTENVLKMSARTLQGPGSRISWLAHRSVIPQIAALKIGVEPSWTNQNQGLREAPNGMLLGFPMKFSQHCQPVGTQGDLTLIDFSGYASFIHSSGTRFDSSIHLYFDFDISAFRWIVRIGGMPYLSTPVSPYKGSDTLSHFVQLATRS